MPKDQKGSKRNCELHSLGYLLEFLNDYNSNSEGSEDIQEENKTLINASLLGLIYEKITDYKDGSFFIPSFITMYINRETLRSVVVQKFNEHFTLNCRAFDDLKEDLCQTCHWSQSGSFRSPKNGKCYYKFTQGM